MLGGIYTYDVEAGVGGGHGEVDELPVRLLQVTVERRDLVDLALLVDGYKNKFYIGVLQPNKMTLHRRPCINANLPHIARGILLI